MSTATYITGDVFECLAATPDGSVDLILTSPPFLALRSYLPADHPDKGKEIGQEATPADFVDTLLALSAEWRRVLAPHGSIAVELGDTYAGSGGAGGDYHSGGQREGQAKFSGSAKNARVHPECPPDRDPATWRPIRGFPDGKQGGGDGWPEAKSACLIPELYRVALAYGINPLTGQPSPAGRWRVRNTVRWCRPNPPVGALGDKYRPATSDMVIACLDTPAGQRRYFDLDAVREPLAASTVERGEGSPRGVGKSAASPTRTHAAAFTEQRSNPAGAPPLDWWEVSTEPYSGSHYATWPRKLLERPIKSMVPRKVCTVCGEPSRRIVDARRISEPDDSTRAKESGVVRGQERPPEVGWEYERTTIGWTDCGHDAWRPGVVLDPFAGSGTTLAVATGHGHNALGFDLDPRNPDLAVERIGPMFFQHLTLDEYRKREAA